MNSCLSQIEQRFPHIPCYSIQLPDGHTLNDMYQNYGTEITVEWMQEAIEQQNAPSEQLRIHHAQKVSYVGKQTDYYVMGHLPNDLGSMRVSVIVEDHITEKKIRIKLDLFDYSEVQKLCTNLSEREGYNYNQLETELLQLTELLEARREQLFELEETQSFLNQDLARELTPKAEEQAIQFLQQPHLLKHIDHLLETSGITGEENNRLNLFILASTYKMPNPLHALVQGVSGGGKSHLINAIAACMPQEDVVNLTRVTSKSFYHYQGDELMYKLLILQDLDGLDDEALFALRELQSARSITSSATVQDRFGNKSSKHKTVKGHFATVMATTKAEIYFDNMNRAVKLGIDESLSQTQRIIDYQNKQLNHKTDKKAEEQARQVLRNSIRMLKSYEVVNPYADKITLPLEAQSLRRLNYQFQQFIAQITILHQYQRRIDANGRLVTSKKDIAQAVELFFNAIVVKVDELDGSTRQFFEKLKQYVRSQKNGTTHKFTQLEIRQHLNTKKTNTAKYINILNEAEYITVAAGTQNRGFKYIVNYWDDHEKMKRRIKNELFTQIKSLNEH